MSSNTPRLDQIERNLIINGNFDIWQRGTSFSAITNGTAHADRFRYIKAGTMVYTLAQSSDVPTQAQSGFQSAFSLLATVTTAEASLAAGDFSSIRHKIEGYDYQQLHNRKARLQFYVKSSITGTYTIYLSNGAQTRSYVTTYTVNSANTWEKKAIDITFDNSGTWAFDNTIGLIIDHMLSSGTTYQTSTLNAWQTALVASTAGAVNHAATNGSTFQLAQVMLIPQDFTNNSGVDVPFQRAGRTISDELHMCQRYYQKSFSLGTTPANGAGAGIFTPLAGHFSTSITRAGPTNGTDGFPQTIGCPVRFTASMRTSPSLTFYGNNAGNWYVYDGTSTTTNFLAIAGYGISETQFTPGGGAIIGTTNAETIFGGHWTADSEL